jgi:hypothetical protein
LTGEKTGIIFRKINQKAESKGRVKRQGQKARSKDKNNTGDITVRIVPKIVVANTGQ